MDPLETFVGNNGGTYRWEVLPGDFSHLPPHDRPPKRICRVIKLGVSLHCDRRENREPIPVYYRGKDIALLHNKHSGGVAILFNGNSLAGHDLYKIALPTIGMNRTHAGYETYDGPNPDYLCVMDRRWIDRPAVRDHPGLLNGTTHEGDHGYRPPRSWRMRPFSFDIIRDGFVCNTTGHMAMQMAVWLGFTELYCLGLDFGGPHYDGTKSGGNLDVQKRLILEAVPMLQSRGIKLWSCGKRDGIFPYAPFSAICGEANG